ncbi:hypothetical protein JHN49_31080 [Streptomyces sp. MBT57]|nr:hypothetical protein [Streptomyces sp. MBT57]
MDQVATAQLPNQTKMMMLRHLHALLQAAHLVRVTGTQPVDDEFFAFIGSMHRSGIQEDLERAGLWEKVKSAMATLNDMLSSTQGAVQLGQGIAGFLVS